MSFNFNLLYNLSSSRRFRVRVRVSRGVFFRRYRRRFLSAPPLTPCRIASLPTHGAAERHTLSQGFALTKLPGLALFEASVPLRGLADHKACAHIKTHITKKETHT